MSAPEEAPHLRLAGVTRLSVQGRHGHCDAYLFEPHRLAFSCWALHAQSTPSVLLTFDRHFDLVPPRGPAPDARAGHKVLDEYARWQLDTRNLDHILAAMDAGLISDAVVIARSNPRGALTGDTWVDTKDRSHRIFRAASLDRLTQDAHALISQASSVLLDFDLDCFTTPSDADPTALVPWTTELIREHLLAGDSFWAQVLPRVSAMTFALEPLHCGGVIAAHKLFERAAEVIFHELLGADTP
ncbi:MAG: hypothetical protein ACT4TC_01395 [Myxococcaceae bacterium]